MITELLAQLLRTEFSDYFCQDNGNKSFQQYCGFIEDVFGEFYDVMEKKDFEKKLRSFIELQKERSKPKDIDTVATYRSKMNSASAKENRHRKIRNSH